ncbi:MAG TPA: hypothetical protein VKA05_08975, partial [Acidimicrobiales bacterium]|nr:hypothetical protein [Acidimicrobiales bacterium]
MSPCTDRDEAEGHWPGSLEQVHGIEVAPLAELSPGGLWRFDRGAGRENPSEQAQHGRRPGPSERPSEHAARGGIFSGTRDGIEQVTGFVKEPEHR